ADQLYAEGENQLNTAAQLDESAKTARSVNDQKRQLSKSTKVRNEGLQMQITASEQYAPANKISYDLYTQKAIALSAKNHPQYVSDAAQSSLELSKTHKNLAAAKRREALAETDLKKKLQILTEANEFEFMAVDEAQHAFDIYSGKVTVEKPQEEVVQQEVQQPQQEGFAETHSSKIVYKVQVAASMAELPIERIREIYKTKAGEVINNEIEDGWYKYAVGSFETYAEAQAYKDLIGVADAFIIAYREEEKILLPEVEAKIKSGDYVPEPKVQSDIIYKVQIAATRIPARPSQLEQMYHGKQIVNILKKNGWYKYVVGNFDTLAKAEAFKLETGLPDAFVVATDRFGNDIQIK
ncbi:MAG: hypothetical protein RIS47_2272, partial [Bacteroidota bacterium]